MTVTVSSVHQTSLPHTVAMILLFTNTPTLGTTMWIFVFFYKYIYLTTAQLHGLLL